MGQVKNHFIENYNEMEDALTEIRKMLGLGGRTTHRTIITRIKKLVAQPTPVKSGQRIRIAARRKKK